jgi:hypothetical protein
MSDSNNELTGQEKVYPERHAALRGMIEEARESMAYHGKGWTDEQLLASYALAVLRGGYHHLMDKIRPCGPKGVETRMLGTLSTFDCMGLTNAVLIAHQMGVRLEIGGAVRGRLWLRAHARVTCDDRELVPGFERHPSLKALAGLLKRWELQEPE